MTCGLAWLLCSLAVAVSVAHTLSAVSQVDTPVRQLPTRTTSHARVVVVNDMPGHFEVLAGVLHVLRLLDVRPEVLYMGVPGIIHAWGLLDWLGQQSTVSHATREAVFEHVGKLNVVDVGADGFNTAAAHWVPLESSNQTDSLHLHANLVICVSPELAPAVCKGVVKAVNPSLAVLWVHRADVATPSKFPLDIRHHLVALAPHVAKLSASRMHTNVTWTLPLAPYHPNPGQECNLRSCLSGFTLQGSVHTFKTRKVTGFTRDYAKLWTQMVELKAARRAKGRAAKEADPDVRVLVLGKGTREQLLIPAEISGDVEHQSHLRYQDFWGRIHRSLALVPAFGMATYYQSRVSSTIGASLTTCTPLIAEQRLLDTYTFLGPEHVFLRLPGESEAVAMYRVASLPEEEVLSRRRALLELREELTRSAEAKFSGWLEEAELPIKPATAS
eukprot:CAMPEP_0119116000 /NCGR_PEP_ID=MMETSP1180-20130426/52044_1 /TAXON_ID=3052 ORGANISM="Chlamydomonas cf sp, Strain CCMP681" /NCGR_SAMPLE_ID=MMETSP1180 /ASSEMBLY_ACC=CAM_ASM_000741 /LENGTH=443 /DNA_ID=CAMNT_0007105111 /DNA_START=18 /DNA_END=1349 /DNA_ORIENTATION=+